MANEAQYQHVCVLNQAKSYLSFGLGAIGTGVHMPSVPIGNIDLGFLSVEMFSQFPLFPDGVQTFVFLTLPRWKALLERGTISFVR